MDSNLGQFAHFGFGSMDMIIDTAGAEFGSFLSSLVCLREKPQHLERVLVLNHEQF